MIKNAEKAGSIHVIQSSTKKYNKSLRKEKYPSYLDRYKIKDWLDGRAVSGYNK